MSFFLKQACTWVHSPPRRSDSTNCANSLRQFPAFFWVLKHTFLLCVSPKIAPMKPNLSISQYVCSWLDTQNPLGFHRTNLSLFFFFPVGPFVVQALLHPDQLGCRSALLPSLASRDGQCGVLGATRPDAPDVSSMFDPGMLCGFLAISVGYHGIFGVSIFGIPKINGVYFYDGTSY